MWREAISAGFCALLALGPAIAAGAPILPYSSGTLKRIDETGIVRLGHRENSPPFAFLDAKKKPIGYSLDICEVVVDEIAREVGKELTVEYRAVTPENRFELVSSGVVAPDEALAKSVDKVGFEGLLKRANIEVEAFAGASV